MNKLDELHAAQRDLRQMLICEQDLEETVAQGEREITVMQQRMVTLQMTRAYFKTTVAMQRAKVAALQTEAGIAPVTQNG